MNSDVTETNIPAFTDAQLIKELSEISRLTAVKHWAMLWSPKSDKWSALVACWDSGTTCITGSEPSYCLLANTLTHSKHTCSQHTASHTETLQSIWKKIRAVNDFNLINEWIPKYDICWNCYIWNRTEYIAVEFNTLETDYLHFAVWIPLCKISNLSVQIV